MPSKALFNRCAEALALLTLIGAPLPVFSESGEDLVLIYIDANIGGSSGGHVGLRIDDTVYHFANEEGATRLIREPWRHFRFVYNDLDNRNLHLAHVRVPAGDIERIRIRLGLLSLVQAAHLDHRAALYRDVRWLEAIAAGHPLDIPGWGFFQATPSPHSMGHTELIDRMGALTDSGFLSGESTRIHQGLLSASHLGLLPETVKGELDWDRYPVYPDTLSERLEDLLVRRLVIGAITQAWSLKDGLLIDAGALVSEQKSRLSVSERVWLTRYADYLAEGITRGLMSRSIGSGSFLLLSLARYQAVLTSLATDRLLMLDILPEGPGTERLRVTEANRSSLESMLKVLEGQLVPHRAALLVEGEPDEMAYQRLEHLASEIREIRRGLAHGGSIRFTRDPSPPKKSASLELPDELRSWRGSSTIPIRLARERANRFQARIQEQYGYFLLGPNCVTELVRSMNSAFPDESDRREALGGSLEPGQSLSFIPFRFFERVRQIYRIRKVDLLPSYRHRMLAKQALKGGWEDQVRELTTFASRIYHAHPGDSSFLMFTDDLFWTRPLLGGVNLLYGLGATAVGVVAIPFDGSEQTREGLRGVLFSLPELFFWNIRKGSFQEFDLQTETGSG